MEFEKLMAKVMAETKKQLEDVFYEIEYDACPMPGVGKFVPKSRKVEKAPTDPVRDRFYRMREIGRENRSLGARGNSFYDGRVRQENSKYNQNNGFKLSIISTVVSAASVIASLVIALTVK